MKQPKLWGLEAFAELGSRDRLDEKPNLLRVLTEFYVQKPTHSAEEERHFVELALRLIEEVDDRTRAEIAQRLATYGSAPRVVTSRLAGTGRDRATAQAPATDETLAAPRVRSDDVTAARRFTDYFFAADSAARRAMLAELASESIAAMPGFAGPAAAGAVQRLEIAALAGRPFEFVREIEHTLNIGRRHAERIVNDPSGEPMLVVARALDMPVDVLQRVLLLVNPLVGTSVRRVFDLSALYRDISQQAALRMIVLWRHAREAPATHQPVVRADTPLRSDTPAPRATVAPDRKRGQFAS